MIKYVPVNERIEQLLKKSSVVLLIALQLPIYEREYVP